MSWETEATVIALLYICIIFWKNRKRLKEKQMQIRQSSFMFEVQQILFESHHMPDLMVDALQRVAETVEAEGVILLSSVNNQIGSRAAWYRKDTDFQAIVLERNLKKDFPTAYQYLMKNQCILYYADKADTFFSEEERKTLEIFGIRSLMLVSVMDKEGLKGVLCAINLERRWNDCSYLDCVAHSFMMAMRNIDSYQIIRDMGAIDTLTGMKNRNSYEKELPDYAGAEYETLHCIYIDVNDLHGINNRYGHEEGDRMLRCVADAIREGFGREHAYRIGGDEFVIFSSEKENFLTGRLERMRRFVESKGYFISIGISGQKGGQINLEKLIAEAEAEMYREKKTYYQRHDRRKKPRRNEPESVL